MRITYKKADINKESMGSECMAPVILSKQSIGENERTIGGEGDDDDEADANMYDSSFWDDE